LPFDVSALYLALFQGVITGGFFALASVGLSIIFGVQRILNVAQGAFIILASFLTIRFSISLTPVWHVDPLYSILIDAAVMALVGVAAYFLIIYRIESSGFQAPLLATFGLSIFLEYVISNGLSLGNYKIIPVLDPSNGLGASPENQVYSISSIQVLSVPLPETLLFAFLIAIIVIPLLHFFFTRTYFGRSIRATAQDFQAAEFSGIDVRLTRAFSFALGSALAGLAGGVFAFTEPVTPTLGDTYLLPIMLIVIILGGIGSVFGTLIGGIIVGVIIEVGDFLALGVLGQYHFGADFGQLVAFLVFIVVLMVRPSGLFGVSLRR
jgi:branched-chain amino acid transport system permease protein